MSLFSRRTVAALAIATVVTVPLATSAAQAHPGHSKGTAHSKSHVKKTKHFQSRFVATGRVKAVGDENVTLTVKGGNLKKARRGTDIVVAVPATAHVTVNGQVKTLSAITAGDRIAVHGTRARAEGVVTYTAKKVRVKHVEPQETSPGTSTPEPSTPAS